MRIPRSARCLFFLARMEVASGAWDEAERLCDEAMAVGRETGREMTEPLCLMILAELAALRGEAERARREIPELLRVAEEASYAGAIYRLARALALLELSCGDASASWRAVAAHFAEVGELDDYHAHLAGSVGIEAAIGVRRPLARRSGCSRCWTSHVSGADTALRPLAHRCRGLLEAAQGDHESAIAALEAAAADPEPPQGVNPVRARQDAARARDGATQGAAQA